jgi:hypothetical protein
LVDAYRFESLVNPNKRTVELALFPKELLADIVVAFMALGSTPIPSSAGYGRMTYGKANWIEHIKPLICARYHDHSSSPA